MQSSITSSIKGLTADSRDVRSGYLFAALPGTRFDGRDFIETAIMNGATHILAPTDTPLPDHVIGIFDDHPRQAFAKLAAKFYAQQPALIVGVTGTNGKTSTVDFIRQIWLAAGKKAASLGTLGLIGETIKEQGRMTTPDPVKLHAMLADLSAAGIDHLTMEASSHGLDQYRLDGVKMSVAAFTNLTQDHLDYHQDMDAYFSAKARLFSEILPDNGTAIINIDEPYGARLASTVTQKTISVGMSNDATMRLVSQVPTVAGQDLTVKYAGIEYDIHLPLTGLFQAYNALTAAACCIAVDLDVITVFETLEKLHGVTGRMQMVARHADNAAAYVDYAHTPDALEQVLKALRPHVSGKLICVFGAGGDRDKSKRPQMGRIVAQYADVSIVTDDNPRSEKPDSIRNDILSACSSAENIGDRRAAIARGVALLNAGDILLVAGKGHEQGQTIGEFTHPFDDIIETSLAMEARGK